MCVTREGSGGCVVPALGAELGTVPKLSSNSWSSKWSACLLPEGMPAFPTVLAVLLTAPDPFVRKVCAGHGAAPPGSGTDRGVVVEDDEEEDEDEEEAAATAAEVAAVTTSALVRRNPPRPPSERDLSDVKYTRLTRVTRTERSTQSLCVPSPQSNRILSLSVHTTTEGFVPSAPVPSTSAHTLESMRGVSRRNAGVPEDIELCCGDGYAGGEELQVLSLLYIHKQGACQPPTSYDISPLQILRLRA